MISPTQNLSNTSTSEQATKRQIFLVVLKNNKKGHCSAGTTVALSSVSAKIPFRTRVTAPGASSPGKSSNCWKEKETVRHQKEFRNREEVPYFRERNLYFSTEFPMTR